MVSQTWDPRQLPDLTGHSYLVTGSTAGLGFFSSQQLAGAGAHVVMTGRNPNRLVAARDAVVRQVPDASVETLLLDTSNLGSIRAAAASVRSRGRLDGLLLNAGIVHAPAARTTTPDGHEIVFATNALGHFALAGALLSTLAAASGRMVWLGSMSTWISPYNPVDLQLERNYSPWRSYVQSKVTTTALGFEADRRLRAAGADVQSVVAHPGYSVSGRTRGVAGVNEPSRRKRFTDNLQAVIAQSKERGAWSLVRALADPTVEGGQFWGPKAITRGEPAEQTAAKVTRDGDIARRLWTRCEYLTGVKWPFAEATAASLAG